MERLLARLERRFGRWAIPNLTWYLVGLGALVFALDYAKPGFTQILLLDPALVMKGQVWRLVTYLFIPPPTSAIFILFALYFTWLFGTSLEAEWGAFKYNVFYLIGMLGTTSSAFILGTSVSNMYLNMTIFLAFATLFPDYEIVLFFLIPVKVKWLAWLSVVGLAMVVVFGGFAERVATIVAVANYLLFFQGTIRQSFRRGAVRVSRVGQRSRFQPPERQVRTCAICGKSDRDADVDIRICSCDKCGKPTELCLEHARNH